MKTRAQIVLLALWFGLCAELAADEPAENPGLSFISVGNSHANLLRLLDPLAKAAGHSQHRNDEIYILGAPLKWNWDHPDKWEVKLAQDKPWDSLLLLSWGGDDETYAPKFAAEAFKANPKCQVLIYTIWPDANMDWEQPPEIRTEKHTENVANAVAAAFPQAPKPKVVPSSLLIREIGRLADRGEIPGMKSRFEVYSDGGHLSNLGQYAVNVMVCSILYDESPLDYPDSIIRYDNKGKAQSGTYVSVVIPPETSKALRRIVWDILSTYPQAGMTPRLAIADRSLPAVVAGQPYRHELKLLNGRGAIQWTLVAGQLPGGLTLSERGLLEGKTGQIGETELVLRAQAGNGMVERTVKLEVADEKPLAIQPPDFGTVGLDKYVLKELKADGGVGHKTWTVTAGKLPYGLRVLPSGMIDGTPGEAGEFTFTVRVADSHPAGSRTAECAIRLTVGPAAPDTLLVKKVPFKAVIEAAAITEPFWRFDQPVAIKIEGQPVKKAAFSAVWEDAEQKSGKKTIEGCGLWLAVKVMDGSAGPSKKDGVHIYIDGCHNREIIYNADDIHFFISRNHKPGKWATVICGMRPNWFTKAFVQEIEGGYCVKVFLSGGAYFGGVGNWLPFASKGVYGFDVAVEEDAGRQAWCGNGKIDENTSCFGSIVLTEESAVK